MKEPTHKKRDVEEDSGPGYLKWSSKCCARVWVPEPPRRVYSVLHGGWVAPNDSRTRVDMVTPNPKWFTEAHNTG